MNDEDRREWVENDEGLYNLWRDSPGYDENRGPRGWIRKHRALIDEVIGNVRSGRKPAHYLAYPPGGKYARHFSYGG